MAESILLGFVGALLYVIWDLSEWVKEKKSKRVPGVSFILKSIVYIGAACAICYAYTNKGTSLPAMAAIQIGLSSPLIVTEFIARGSKGILKEMRAADQDIG